MTSFHLRCLLNALSPGLGILGVRASTRGFTGDTVQFRAGSLQSDSFEYRLKIQKKKEDYRNFHFRKNSENLLEKPIHFQRV